MRCPNKKKLSAYLDGELSERETWWIRQHLEDCAQCNEELNILTIVDETLGLLKGLPPDPYFAGQVIARVKERRPVLSLRKFLVPAVATAVGVVSIFLGGLFGQVLYAQWVDESGEEESDFGEYFGVIVLEDYPQGSFGEVADEIIEEGDQS